MRSFKDFLLEIHDDNNKIVDLSAKRDEKAVTSFAKTLGAAVEERVKRNHELVMKYKEDGKFPLDVGERFHTPFTKERNQPPYEVTGHRVVEPSKRRPGDPVKYGYSTKRTIDGHEERSFVYIHDGKKHHGAGFMPFGKLKVVK